MTRVLEALLSFVASHVWQWVLLGLLSKVFLLDLRFVDLCDQRARLRAVC